MALNFADALDRYKKKAQQRGRPVSEQEVAGIAKGAAREAHGRLIAKRNLELQKERQEEQKRQFERQMAQNEADRKAAEKASAKQTTTSAAATGATLGYTAIGTAAGGVYGAIIGGVLGSIVGDCIIIGACTSLNSYEVNIAREFRDKYLSDACLGGYYAIGIPVVKLMKKSHFFKLFIKKFLVDRLIDYGEWILGYKPKRKLISSKVVTKGFLRLCAAFGLRYDFQSLVEAHRS